MKKKVLIIGAGWFGCHLFKNLNRKKYSLKIFEKNNSIFLLNLVLIQTDFIWVFIILEHPKQDINVSMVLLTLKKSIDN